MNRIDRDIIKVIIIAIIIIIAMAYVVTWMIAHPFKPGKDSCSSSITHVGRNTIITESASCATFYIDEEGYNLIRIIPFTIGEQQQYVLNKQ